MSIETITYMGLPNCLKLSNGTVDVIASTAVGPRILFYGPSDGKNLLAWFPENKTETALGTWKPYGGHRIWVWPELFPATYAPDNEPIEHAVESELSLLLKQPVDSAGIEKQIRVTLAASGTQVTVEQTITSRCLWPVEIAPWAITVVASGTGIVPRVPFQTHDENVTAAQPIALWTFTNLEDSRFTLGSRFLLLRADAAKTDPQKFGLRNKQDWCAHLVEDTLFVKRFRHEDGAEYPDQGVNNEVYVEGSYMEVELLGPRRLVAPGESLTLVEDWHLFAGVGVSATESDEERLHRAIEPKVRELF